MLVMLKSLESLVLVFEHQILRMHTTEAHETPSGISLKGVHVWSWFTLRHIIVEAESLHKLSHPSPYGSVPYHTTMALYISKTLTYNQFNN